MFEEYGCIALATISPLSSKVSLGKMNQTASHFLQTEVLAYYQTTIAPELECLGFDSDYLRDLLAELAQEVDPELVLSEQQQAEFLEHLADTAISFWSNEFDSLQSCKQALKDSLSVC